jgi:hypothetical protein
MPPDVSMLTKAVSASETTQRSTFVIDPLKLPAIADVNGVWQPVKTERMYVRAEIWTRGDLQGIVRRSFSNPIWFVQPRRGNVFVADSNGTSFDAREKRHDFFCIDNELCDTGDFNGDGADDIIAFTKGLLAGFKCPKANEFCELPKTATGKIQKFKLREKEWAGKGKVIMGVEFKGG